MNPRVIVRPILAVGRVAARLVDLIRTGQDDIQATYPEHYDKVARERHATQGSLGGMGLDGGAGAGP